MEIVYLANGQACHLKETIGNKYVINKIFEYEKYEGDESYWCEFSDSVDIIVDTIFRNKPIEKIDQEIKQLQLKKEAELKAIADLENQKRGLKYEIEQLRKTQISKDKFIIDRSELVNATNLVLFTKDKVMPIRIDGKSIRGLKLSTTIELYNGNENSWGYEIHEDYRDSGNILCKKYGILINPTEEEIEDVIRKRLLEFKFSEYYIKTTDDKYLTTELIEMKKTIIKKENDAAINRLENEIKASQQKLSALQN